MTQLIEKTWPSSIWAGLLQQARKWQAAHQAPCCGLYFACVIALMSASTAAADDVKETEVFQRIRAAIEAMPAISTHDHLNAFDRLPGRVETESGIGMTLPSVWALSYYNWVSPISKWPASGKFDEWWKTGRYDFRDARAMSVYRYMLPAFRDLYGVDFDSIDEAGARQLNDTIFERYQDSNWAEEVVTERANIELMFIDPFWARLKVERNYKFAVPVLNVSRLIEASHPSRCRNPLDGPYFYAQQWGMKTESFDEFLVVVEEILRRAVAADAICLKSSQAYERSLRYEEVPKERASAVYGQSPGEVSEKEQREFEDFMFWHVCRLSAKYDLPLQIHTGQARLEGSNPMLLVNVIAANPDTKFVLFHGGYPWIGETGVIAMRHRNVWIDSNWLPTLSYTTAKRAYQEWLEVVPSNRILWGADSTLPEAVYGATVFTRQCLAEALAEKVQAGELREDHAIRIGRQVMRGNALALFPKLRRMLWRRD